MLHVPHGNMVSMSECRQSSIGAEKLCLLKSAQPLLHLIAQNSWLSFRTNIPDIYGGVANREQEHAAVWCDRQPSSHHCLWNFTGYHNRAGLLPCFDIGEMHGRIRFHLGGGIANYLDTRRLPRQRDQLMSIPAQCNITHEKTIGKRTLHRLFLAACRKIPDFCRYTVCAGQQATVGRKCKSTDTRGGHQLVAASRRHQNLLSCGNVPDTRAGIRVTSSEKTAVGTEFECCNAR